MYKPNIQVHAFGLVNLCIPDEESFSLKMTMYDAIIIFYVKY